MITACIRRREPAARIPQVLEAFLAKRLPRQPYTRITSSRSPPRYRMLRRVDMHPLMFTATG